MSCCQSCTFCLKCAKAVAKERHKSFIKVKKRNKFCERCFYCRSLCFCPKCSQCPQCCSCQASGRLSPKFWAGLVPPGCKSKGSVSFERRLHSSVQNQTSAGERPVDNQWVCKSPQGPLPEGSFACTDPQESSREGKGSDLSSLLQQIVHCPQTKSEMAANLGPQYSKPIFVCENIQNGDPGDNSNRLATRGMGDIAGFQRRLFPYTSTHPVPKVPLVSLPKPTAPMEFTWVVKEVKLMAQSRGIRIHWLIRAPTKESCHQDTQSLLALCQELGWIVNLQKSELEPKQVFDFVGYHCDLLHGLVKLTQNRHFYRKWNLFCPI